MPVTRMLVLGLALAVLLPATAGAAKPERRLYVSLGDSYATGFQVRPDGTGANTRNGFAYQVPKFAKRRGYRFKLVNFGCGGENTTSTARIPPGSQRENRGGASAEAGGPSMDQP